MPLITIILFFIFVGLLFALATFVKNRKKLEVAKAYGIKNFDIELPPSASILHNKATQGLPRFMETSDAGAFYRLVTPYIGSLSTHKREYLHQHIEDLKNDLKINKEIYRYFTDEYKIYEGLNDEDAAIKWSGK